VVKYERFLELDKTEDSPAMTFVGGDFKPMGLPAYRIFINEGVLSVDIVNARETSSPELSGKFSSYSTEIKTTYTSGTAALLKNGWLPPAFLSHDVHILLDRNAVTEIAGFFVEGELRRERRDDLIEFLLSQGPILNPSLYALEGNEKRVPTHAEMADLVIEANDKLARALPECEIRPKGLAGIEGLKGLLKDSESTFNTGLAFLEKAVPLVQSSGKLEKRLNATKSIVELAKLHQPSLLTRLACLSALWNGQDFNPARKLLKPAREYTQEMAYNALCDLRIIELFVGITALQPSNQFAVMTKDIGLIQFWLALKARNIRLENDHTAFDFTIDSDLFLDLPETELDLIKSAL
jgi:hypothetical protein